MLHQLVAGIPHGILVLCFRGYAVVAVIHVNDGIAIRIEGRDFHPGHQFSIGGLGAFIIIFDLMGQGLRFGGIFEDDVIAVDIFDASVGVAAVSQPGARFYYCDGKIGQIHRITAVADDLVPRRGRQEPVCQS